MRENNLKKEALPFQDAIHFHPQPKMLLNNFNAQI